MLNNIGTLEMSATSLLLSHGLPVCINEKKCLHVLCSTDIMFHIRVVAWFLRVYACSDNARTLCTASAASRVYENKCLHVLCSTDIMLHIRVVAWFLRVYACSDNARVLCTASALSRVYEKKHIIVHMHELDIC